MKKRVKKFRGSRTCGGGRKRRGRGSRGGGGGAGRLKHKYLRTLKNGYEFGKHGFTRPKSIKKEHKAVKNLQKMLRELRAKKKLDEHTYNYLSSKPELNVGDIDEILDRLVELGIASKDGSAYKLDLNQLGYTKLLGRGSLTKAVKVKVLAATQKAVAKIEGAGGQIIE
jgi:large subunit ribosomal protein L15